MVKTHLEIKQEVLYPDSKCNDVPVIAFSIDVPSGLVLLISQTLAHIMNELNHKEYVPFTYCLCRHYIRSHFSNDRGHLNGRFKSTVPVPE